MEYRFHSISFLHESKIFEKKHRAAGKKKEGERKLRLTPSFGMLFSLGFFVWYHSTNVVV